MDLTALDLNSLPVWVVAIAIVLVLLPKILQGLAPFIPPLSLVMDTHKKRIEAAEERRDTQLHWKLESNGMRLGEEFKSQERMLDILENSLKKMWDDRESREANYKQVSEELVSLRHHIDQMGGTLSLHGSNIAKLTDRVEAFDDRLGQLPERINSLGAYIEEAENID